MARHSSIASGSASLKGGPKQSTLRPPQTRSRLVTSRASMAGWRPSGVRPVRAPSRTSGRTGARPAATTKGSPRGPSLTNTAPAPCARARVASARKPAMSPARRNRASTARQVRAVTALRTRHRLPGRARRDDALRPVIPAPTDEDGSGQSLLPADDPVPCWAAAEEVAAAQSPQRGGGHLSRL